MAMINAYSVDDIIVLCWPGGTDWGEPDGVYTELPVKGYIASSSLYAVCNARKYPALCFYSWRDSVRDNIDYC